MTKLSCFCGLGALSTDLRNEYHGLRRHCTNANEIICSIRSQNPLTGLEHAAQQVAVDVVLLTIEPYACQLLHAFHEQRDKARRVELDYCAHIGLAAHLPAPLHRPKRYIIA